MDMHHATTMPAPGESWGMPTLDIVKAPAMETLKWAAYYASRWNDTTVLTATDAAAMFKTPPVGSSSYLVRSDMVLYSPTLNPIRGDFLVVVTDERHPSFKVHRVVK